MSDKSAGALEHSHEQAGEAVLHAPTPVSAASAWRT